MRREIRREERRRWAWRRRRYGCIGPIVPLMTLAVAAGVAMVAGARRRSR